MQDKEQDKCSSRVGANTQSQVYTTRCAVDSSGAKAKPTLETCDPNKEQ